MIKHLNLIKNPVNPMFAGQSQKYDTFRAKFKIWLPSLVTLDGIDFSKDEVHIAEIRSEIEGQKRQALARGAPLGTIPEEQKSNASGSGAASGGAAAAGGQ